VLNRRPGGPSSHREGPEVSTGGPSSQRQGPEVSTGGPSSQRQGPEVSSGGPSSHREGPKIGWDGRVPGGRGASSGRRTRRISESLSLLTDRLGKGGDARTLSAIFSRWEEVVGAPVAAHAQPLSLRAKELLVEVDHPTWATQLRFLTDTILEKLSLVSGVEGAVTSIKVTVGNHRADRMRSRKNRS